MADSGYVYLVTHANAQGLHKIGLTRNPEQRTAQLGGDDCTVIAMVMCINPEHVEGLLHKRFAANRLPQSEWFDLMHEELQEVCDVLLTAHEEATRFVVLPSRRLEPEPEPETEPEMVLDPGPPPKTGPNGFLAWTEAEAKHKAAGHRVVYRPGIGYCYEMNS